MANNAETKLIVVTDAELALLHAKGLVASVIGQAGDESLLGEGIISDGMVEVSVREKGKIDN